MIPGNLDALIDRVAGMELRQELRAEISAAIMARPEEPPPDKRYNGWTNYATWRVNLELLSDYCDSLEGDRQTFADVAELASALEDYVTECFDRYDDGGGGILRDYAEAFVSDVNYEEIADHYPGLIESDDDDDDDDEGDA
jgi:hypothetical protein